MKKVVYVFMIFVFVLVGCADVLGSNKLIAYDKEKVINILSELEFNPEFPNLLPFEPVEIKINSEANFISISFVNDNQEEITFRASIAPNAFDFTEENIKITENVSGKFGDKDNLKVLTWDKDNIYYELLANSNSTSRNELVEIAKSPYVMEANLPMDKERSEIPIKRIDLNDSKEIAIFSKAVSDSTKVPGIVNITNPQYEFKLGEERYFLWSTEDSGTIMNIKESHTIYTLSTNSAKVVNEFVNQY